MTNEIKTPQDILDYINDRVIPNEYWDKVLDYITNLQEEIERQEKSQVILDNQNAELKETINKAIEYGKNRLENLKDQEDYLCESIDIVGLLRMIHKNYIDILQGEDK